MVPPTPERPSIPAFPLMAYLDADETWPRSPSGAERVQDAVEA
jgi:hypothetical protein